MVKFLDDIRTGELWTKVKEVVSAAQQAAVSAITSQKNQPNGIAGLDSSGKLQQMPAAIADHVVEQGKSGLWTYRKWESGVAECWGEIPVSLEKLETAMTEVSGRVATVNLPPGLFSEKPRSANASTQWHFVEWTTISIDSSSSFSLRIFGNGNSGNVMSTSCGFYVIGSWK